MIFGFVFQRRLKLVTDDTNFSSRVLMVQVWVSKPYGVYSTIALLGTAGEMDFAVELTD
jgi:hypothetical protein